MKEIKDQTAHAVGNIIFEFNRLDMNLGLCLFGAGRGKNLEEKEKINDKNFHDRLVLLEELALEKFKKDSVEFNSYGNWLRDAHRVRGVRNELVHGRWGFISSDSSIANVTGLPASNSQREKRYTVDQLQSIVKRIGGLSKKLQEISDQFPI